MGKKSTERKSPVLLSPLMEKQPAHYRTLPLFGYAAHNLETTRRMNDEIDPAALSPQDAENMWHINEEGLPGVGEVNPSQLKALVKWSVFTLGAFEEEKLVGVRDFAFPGTSYHSLNYRWFNEHYSALYVDRIAVGEAHRNRGVGSMLCEEVHHRAENEGIPVAAEVNLVPLNAGSMRFHKRQGYSEVGVLKHPTYTVTMMMRSPV